MAFESPPPPAIATADEAIALVLRHERSARDAIAAARARAQHVAEAARADARAIAARAERRMRCVAAAFEREAQARTVALDAQALAMAQAHVPTPRELAQVARAVHELAAELTAGAP